MTKCRVPALRNPTKFAVVADAVMELSKDVPNHRYWLLVDYAYLLQSAARESSAVFSLDGFYAVCHKLLKQRAALGDDQHSQLLSLVLGALWDLGSSSEKLFLELVDHCLSIGHRSAADHCASLISASVEWGLCDSLLKRPAGAIEWLHGLLVRFVLDRSFERNPSERIKHAAAFMGVLMSEVASNESLTEAFAKLWTDVWDALCDRLSSSSTSNLHAEVSWEAVKIVIEPLIDTLPDSVDIENFMQEACNRLPTAHHDHFLRLMARQQPVQYRDFQAKIKREKRTTASRAKRKVCALQ